MNQLEARALLNAVRDGTAQATAQEIERALRLTGDIKTCPPCFGDCNQGRECPARSGK